MSPGEFLTIKETAARLKVVPRTVHKYLRAGLPYIKLGGAVRVAASDLDSWILSHRRSASLPLTRVEVVELRGKRKAA
jgi:excisionase family DNA binding protein